MKEMYLEELSSSELNEINGGLLAYVIGYLAREYYEFYAGFLTGLAESLT